MIALEECNWCECKPVDKQLADSTEEWSGEWEVGKYKMADQRDRRNVSLENMNQYVTSIMHSSIQELIRMREDWLFNGPLQGYAIVALQLWINP